jgi:hypothetical protein
MVGVYLFYRAAVMFLQREDIRILYILAFFPGILFWSSILGKDPIMLLGISLYVYSVVAWYQLRRPRYLLTLALGLLIICLIRMWVVPIVVAPLMVFVVKAGRSFIWRMALMAIAVLAFVLILPKMQSLLGVSNVEDTFAFRNYAVTAFQGGGSSLAAPKITGFSDMIVSLPLGIFTALFRPLPWDVRNLFGFLQGLDGLVLLMLLVKAVMRTRLKELADPILLWAIALILAWAAFYGLTVYNFGTLVRYKLQILPLLLGVLLYLSRRRRASVVMKGDRGGPHSQQYYSEMQE